MDWITQLKPPRYLRYFFYIIFMWYQKEESEKDDAHWTAILFLIFPHSAVLIFFMPWFFFDDYVDLEKLQIAILFVLILGFHYFMFLFKDKWISFIKEFEYVTKRNRKIGTIYVLIYLTVLLFLTIVPILVGELSIK